MNKEDKRKVFSIMAKSFETELLKEYFLDMVECIPDYIFTMPSSTSGKYHNKTQCEKFGQIYHIYMFASVLNHRLRLKGNMSKYNTPEIRDCMRCIPVFHDAMKCGVNNSGYTVHEHPILAGEWVRTTKVLHDIPDEYKDFIANMCESHSGEWTTNKRSTIILPEPRNDAEFFIHECDILSSRADLDMIIPEELRAILNDLDVSNDENITLEEYRVTFGRYIGLTLREIYDKDPGYIKWMKEKINQEPIKSLLKEVGC